MKVYEVKVKEYREYKTVKFFSSKKKAVDYILSQGECYAITEESETSYNDKWYYKNDMSNNKWNKLIKKEKYCYHIFRGDIYIINKINVE